VVADELPAVDRSQLVLLERLQVPMAMRRADVVTHPSDPVEAPKATAAKPDELVGAHRRYTGALSAALDHERPEADVLDGRSEHEPRVEVPGRTSPTDRDRQRRPLVEVGQERVGERSRSASDTNSRPGQHPDESDPATHCSVITPFARHRAGPEGFRGALAWLVIREDLFLLNHADSGR